MGGRVGPAEYILEDLDDNERFGVYIMMCPMLQWRYRCRARFTYKDIAATVFS